MDLSDEQILDSDLEKSFELLKIIRLDYGEPDSREEELEVKYLDSIIEKVKSGINQRFDIIHFLTENYVEDLTNQKVYIPNKRLGKQISLQDFANELEDRKTLAKKVLLEFNSKESFFVANQS